MLLTFFFGSGYGGPNLSKYPDPTSWGKSKFILLYEPIEHDFERPSFEIRAQNHFRALILP